MITGIASSIIALCALLFSFWQGHITRKHNRISVKPHLTTWEESNPQEGHYKVALHNNGIGPALIKNFTIKVDGEIIEGEKTEKIEKALEILFPNLGYTSNHSWFQEGYAMSANEGKTIVEISFQNPEKVNPSVVKSAIERADVIVEYESMYGEKFTFDSKKLKSNNMLHAGN
ncbi:MAG: hypothetical protein HZA11_02635 [Nitrospirae bacterium]|nr:hypothetical protein [Nitrospirota bacterium]